MDDIKTKSRDERSAIKGHFRARAQDDFNVVRGMRKVRMQNYCRKYCKVDLVVEARSEKDSWNSVSKAAANASKESIKVERKGIKFKIKSIRSQGENNAVHRPPQSGKQSDISQGREKEKEFWKVKQHFQSSLEGSVASPLAGELVPQNKMMVKKASINSSSDKLNMSFCVVNSSSENSVSQPSSNKSQVEQIQEVPAQVKEKEEDEVEPQVVADEEKKEEDEVEPQVEIDDANDLDVEADGANEVEPVAENQPVVQQPDVEEQKDAPIMPEEEQKNQLIMPEEEKKQQALYNEQDFDEYFAQVELPDDMIDDRMETAWDP